MADVVRVSDAPASMVHVSDELADADLVVTVMDAPANRVFVEDELP